MKHIYWKNDNKVTALTTTKEGGVSTGNFEGLNLALHVGDNKEHVLLNREALAHDLSISSEKIVYARQTHSDSITKVTKEHLGSGVFDFESGVDGDALYTTEKGIALAVFHADCVPVFIHVPGKRLVMIIHAGEIGTLKEITYKAIKQLEKNEKINPKRVHAHIGPARTFMNYPTNEETIKRVLELGYNAGAKRSSGTLFIDTQVINYEQLRKAGVPQKNITMTAHCTVERPDLFYSHYRDNNTGRMISLIKLNG